MLMSCTPEAEINTGEHELKAVGLRATVDQSEERPELLPSLTDLHGKVFNDFPLSFSSAVEPSDCGTTPFRIIASNYEALLINDFLTYWDGSIDALFLILNDYFIINQIAALNENKNADYFGADGEFTNYVNKRVRSLEKFWDMPNVVEVRGQHTETLEDLEFIRLVYEKYSDAPEELIDLLLDYAEFFNNQSDQIPENPFYASDGFATFDGFIVVGDGIVQMLSEVGLDPKIVWSSILAHEWAHQIQFLNFGIWEYPLPPFNNTPESTRMTELEADFITGYYLTHKRGATYNWKRVEEVLESFFNIGDCGFNSNGHHGTPIQRMEAARQGFELAKSAQKNGHILPSTAVHDAFLNALDDIVGDSGVVAAP